MTDRTSMGIPAERGAELVHGPNVSTWPLLRPAGIDTHQWNVERCRFNPGSAWVSQRA
ncbi:hypothetical protein [Nocardia araoensis]|uniref:hypothetical protein n=1 Tax=Nocardia araoensis TaxID=228600 RepID=UPI0012F6FB64|nr:hypothetical protein [Nocardia araoensis]